MNAAALFSKRGKSIRAGSFKDELLRTLWRIEQAHDRPRRAQLCELAPYDLQEAFDAASPKASKTRREEAQRALRKLEKLLKGRFPKRCAQINAVLIDAAANKRTAPVHALLAMLGDAS